MSISTGIRIDIGICNGIGNINDTGIDIDNVNDIILVMIMIIVLVISNDVPNPVDVGIGNSNCDDIEGQLHIILCS